MLLCPLVAQAALTSWLLPFAEGVIECSTATSSYLQTVVESTTETFICRSVRPRASLAL